mgnify:CR=1 FL=1
MAAVSFVIPVLNEAEVLPALLQHLRGAFPDAQLVVVDGGSTDGSPALAETLCDQLLHSEPGRARQMNAGALAASGDYLLFLHADSVPGITREGLQRALAERPTWGFCRVQLSGDDWRFRVISRLINWRSRLTRVATGDQMLFVASAVFRESGGFDDIPLMEDVAFSKRLRKVAPPRILSDPVVTSSRRWRERGVLRTVLQMWALRLAFWCGMSPQRLHRSYYGTQSRG